MRGTQLQIVMISNIMNLDSKHVQCLGGKIERQRMQQVGLVMSHVRISHVEIVVPVLDEQRA